jgi:hypothetical protein
VSAAQADESALSELRSSHTIRKRCQNVLTAGLRGELAHFKVDLTRLVEAARVTAEVTRARYPSLDVPAHGRSAHFDAGGTPRLAALMRELADRDALEQARVLTGLIVTSVLLDAGAGAAYHFRDRATGQQIGRSEGLAVASLAWVASGELSSRGHAYDVDAAGLAAVTREQLTQAFQVTEENPLVGVAGRVHLMRELGATLAKRPDVFGVDARLGGLLDYWVTRADHGRLPASTILATLLDALSGIWPGRLTLAGQPLGDVWRHPAAGGEGPTRGLLPLHKLSQWLSYSLLQPLAVAGLKVTDIEALTGLAEYRNGGLFIDTGVLVPTDPSALEREHEVDSALVVEWRALTVALLDRLAPLVCSELGKELTLPSILEGGTWAAGRLLAGQLRPGAEPPIRIRSDGTVF